MQLNHYLISTFSTQNSNNSLIIERYTPYVIRNIRGFILLIKQTSIMEELELRKFWKSIGITTLLIMLGIAISGSLIIIKSNKKSVASEENTSVELDVEIDTDSIMSQYLKTKALNEEGHRVTATVYNPVVGQCDDDPLTTADCSVIDLDKLKSGEIKWVALSRDLLKHFKYGDVIELICSRDSSINGFYEVHDTMNKRFKNYIDILKPCGESLGKWDNVVIRKIES